MSPFLKQELTKLQHIKGCQNFNQLKRVRLKIDVQQYYTTNISILIPIVYRTLVRNVRREEHIIKPRQKIINHSMFGMDYWDTNETFARGNAENGRINLRTQVDTHKSHIWCISLCKFVRQNPV